MSDRAALLAAIREHPDEDTPRLAYADWLDEHAPDGRPSPAQGPSARADYIRVQCRLARHPYDDPEYPALLEREEELARWLDAHAAGDHPELPDDLAWTSGYSHGHAHREDDAYRRGFPDRVEYVDYDEEPEENVERITAALEASFRTATIRTLRLEDAYGAEVAGVAGHPLAAHLRGLSLDYIADDDEATAVAGVARSEHLTGLRRLDLEFAIGPADVRELVRSKNLDGLEELALDETAPAELKALAGTRWFRDLRSLRLYMSERDALRGLADLPPMPNLVRLELSGKVQPAAAAVRRFAAADSFPRLGRLDLDRLELTPELLGLLARGRWPLRHLRLNEVPVRKAGAEALAGAAFAGGLRVLELPECAVPAGGAKALAAAPALAGLRHLDLSDNPVGAGGLAAVARSPHLRGLRRLDLGRNDTKAAPDAAAVQGFLAALDLPDLRHLSLSGLPVGVRGARELAGGRFAGLTKLELRGCGLRETGARALVESAGLPHLAILDARDNNAGKGLAKLGGSKAFPRLGYGAVGRNRVPKPVLAKLLKRPGVEG